MSRLYLFDGTLEGYQSVLSVLWKIAQKGDRLQSETEYMPGFFEETVTLSSVFDPMQLSCCDKTFNEASMRLVYAFASGDKIAVEQTPSFLWYVRENGILALTHFAEPCVNLVIKAARKTAGEAHRLKGLLRFRNMGNVLYGPYFSRNFVLPMLADHFKSRLSNQQWIIHDTKRNTGVFYDGKVSRQAFFSENELKESVRQYEKAGREDSFEILWKKYFDTIAIQYRKNPKLQQSFMPKQYWKYLPEVAERTNH